MASNIPPPPGYGNSAASTTYPSYNSLVVGTSSVSSTTTIGPVTAQPSQNVSNANDPATSSSPVPADGGPPPEEFDPDAAKKKRKKHMIIILAGKIVSLVSACI